MREEKCNSKRNEIFEGNANFQRQWWVLKFKVAFLFIFFFQDESGKLGNSESVEPVPITGSD